jgi:NTP pyrophosphatase (non-canonical NTP hydrolase)
MNMQPARKLDDQRTISDLRMEVKSFVEERNWEGYHTPKNLAISIAIEAAELMEHFQWKTADQSIDAVGEQGSNAEIAGELADVIIYCLSFANSTGIDISSAVLEKLHRNQQRFPVGYMP